MHSLNSQVNSTKNPNDRIRLEREIQATDRHIDRLVYELYGLTDEEIRIAESLLSK
jgi:hypothetical protein